MKKIHKSIHSRLDLIDFNQIVHGFHPCSFAIFNDEKAIIDGIMIDKPSQFLANSVANYKGKLVATYYHDFLPDDLDKATALIVHEMYHVFQFDKMDYQSLLEDHKEINGSFYDYSSNNMTSKYQEVQALIDAYLNRDEKSYKSFLSIRRMRLEKYPAEVMYEDATEFIEGFATYVELKALEQLNETLFQQRVGKMIDSFRNIETYFSIREISYGIGALMLLILTSMKVDISRVIQGETFLSNLYEYHYIPPTIERNKEIEAFVINKAATNKKAVTTFFDQAHEKITFDQVIGYNPMGMIRHKDKLLVKFLVVIKKGEEELTLNGDFCLCFDNKKECRELYRLSDSY